MVALVFLGQQLGVSEACRQLGLSRDTYYRYAKVFKSDGLDALVDHLRDDTAPSRIAPDVEAAIIEESLRDPWAGKVVVAQFFSLRLSPPLP